MYAPTLCALGVTAAFPYSLSQEALPAVIDGITITFFIDSCNSDSFINQQMLSGAVPLISLQCENQCI